MSEPGQGPRIPENVRNALIAGAVLGLVAAGVVWFLERFEVNRLHGEIREYLRRTDVVDEVRRRTKSEGHGE